MEAVVATVLLNPFGLYWQPMVTPISEKGIHAREQEQRAGIHLRYDFLRAGKPTQQKVIDLLEHMNSLMENKGKGEAQIYFFTQISRHQRRGNQGNIDRKGVDWDEVHDQIIYSCFEDHDMDGYSLVERRVQSQLTVFRSLTELPHNDLDDF